MVVTKVAMIRYEVIKHHYVTGGERLDDDLVFGREDAPVFKRLHECVDVVDFVDLGSREVKDKGTDLEASDYCKEEDLNPIIHGNIIKSNPGVRNDIHDAVLHLRAASRSVS